MLDMFWRNFVTERSEVSAPVKRKSSPATPLLTVAPPPPPNGSQTMFLGGSNWDCRLAPKYPSTTLVPQPLIRPSPTVRTQRTDVFVAFILRIKLPLPSIKQLPNHSLPLV